MIFTQYYLDCLSQASYLIGDETTGRAIIVDPRRDIDDYLADARQAQLTVVGVINTHFHADFVSGHLEMAKETGAWIGFSAAAQPDFPVRHLHHGDRISLGDVTLEILETPGHTPESISVLVYEHATDTVPYGVLTGDALFIGDVGRPDLLASVGYTREELGAKLYHSIHEVLMTLDDEVRVFPAHGAGSACGKNLSTERQSTIGAQRRDNYACQPMTCEKFVEIVTEGQPSAPDYFLYNATLNKQDHAVLPVGATVPTLTTERATAALAEGAILLDARPPGDYATGALRGSINVGADGRFAETVGMVVTPSDRLVVLAPEGTEQYTATRLARIGFDQVVGVIADADAFLRAHAADVTPASRITPARLHEIMADRGDVQVVDLRNPGEVAGGTLDDVALIPLAQLPSRREELNPSQPVVLFCAGGWRSSVGASYLRSVGFTDVTDVLGGYNAINPAAVCPATLAAQTANA